MEAMGSIQEAIRNLQGRASSMHQRVGGMQIEIGDAKTEIAVVKRDVEGLAKDVEDVDHRLTEEANSIRKLIREEGESNRSAVNKLVMALVGFALAAAGSAVSVAVTLGGHP